MAALPNARSCQVFLDYRLACPKKVRITIPDYAPPVLKSNAPPEALEPVDGVLEEGGAHMNESSEGDPNPPIVKSKSNYTAYCTLRGINKPHVLQKMQCKKVSRSAGAVPACCMFELS